MSDKEGHWAAEFTAWSFIWLQFTTCESLGFAEKVWSLNCLKGHWTIEREVIKLKILNLVYPERIT